MKRKFQIHNVLGDGNCMYYAIAVSLFYDQYKKLPTEKQYTSIGKNLKVIACISLFKEIENNNTNIIEILSSEIKSTEKNHLKRANLYIKQMLKHNSWGGCIELFALSKYIHEQGYKGVEVFDEKLNKFHELCSVLKQKGKSLKIVFTGNHYKSLVLI
tara:strand:- start:1343 stop:1816 length:474 start_codon:yes stop_codon:yes gene_type:complete